MMPSPNKRTPVARRQLIGSGVLPPRQTPLSRALRGAVTAMTDGVRTDLGHPQAAYNAADPMRSCPTDRVAILVDETCDALVALPYDARSAEGRLEQALAIPRTMEAHIRSRLAPAPVLSPKEHALRVSRTDAAEDMTRDEYLANPCDPSIALRAADMATHEAREKLGWADRLRALFPHPHRGAAR